MQFYKYGKFEYKDHLRWSDSPQIKALIESIHREGLHQVLSQSQNMEQEEALMRPLPTSEQRFVEAIQSRWGLLFTKDDLWPPSSLSSNQLTTWEERYLFLKTIFNHGDTYLLADYQDVDQRMQKKLITLLREDDSWHYQNEVKSLTQILLALRDPSKSEPLINRIKNLYIGLMRNNAYIDVTHFANYILHHSRSEKEVVDFGLNGGNIRAKAISRFQFTLKS